MSLVNRRMAVVLALAEMGCFCVHEPAKNTRGLQVASQTRDGEAKRRKGRTDEGHEE